MHWQVQGGRYAAEDLPGAQSFEARRAEKFSISGRRQLTLRLGRRNSCCSPLLNLRQLFLCDLDGRSGWGFFNELLQVRGGAFVLPALRLYEPDHMVNAR